MNSFVATPSFHSLYFLPSFLRSLLPSFLPSFLSIQLFPSVRPFLSFQLFPFIRHCLPLVSTLSFHSLLPSFHFTSDIPFVTASLRFKSFILLRPSLRFTSYIPFVSVRYFFPLASPLTVRLLLELFCCNSFLSFVTSFLSFQLFPSVRPFLSFQLFPFIRFFKFCGLEQSGLVSAIQAATFSRDPLRPLAPAATCGHLRPLATTCGHLQPLAATCSNSPLRPLAATCDHLHSNGCKRLQEAASGIVFVFCNLNETLGF